MTPRLLNALVIQPVLAELNWPQAEERAVLLLAIAMQESKLKHRTQIPDGPARSFWQIEPETCLDCLHRCLPVKVLWSEVTGHFDSPDDLEYNAIAACTIAAGILRITTGKLPEVGDEGESWRYYLKAWRPGKPGPERWTDSYEAAISAHQAHAHNNGNPR